MTAYRSTIKTTISGYGPVTLARHQTPWDGAERTEDIIDGYDTPEESLLGTLHYVRRRYRGYSDYGWTVGMPGAPEVLTHGEAFDRIVVRSKLVKALAYAEDAYRQAYRASAAGDGDLEDLLAAEDGAREQVLVARNALGAYDAKMRRSWSSEVCSPFQGGPAYRYIRASDRLPTYDEIGPDTPAEEIILKVKVFNPSGLGTWWIAAYNSDTGIAWGVAEIMAREIGSFSMQELADLRVPPLGLPLERDLHYKPRTMAEVLAESR